MDSATLAVRRSFPAAAPAAASDDDAAPLTSAGGRPQREQLTSFGHFRAIVAQVMRLHAVEWTIVGLSVADFVFVLLQIGWTLMRDPQCACDEDCTEEEPLWFKLCGYASLAITSLFLVEIPLDLIGFGFDFYLTQRFHWLHVLDASVVVVAFCLEVAVDSSALALGSIVSILRLWRVVKLVSTAQTGVAEASEAQEEQEAEKAASTWRREKENLESEIEGMRRRLKQYELKWARTPARSEPLVRAS